MNKRHFRIIARHNWVVNALITESICKEDNTITRFTATILSWRNWKIYEDELTYATTQYVMGRVMAIRDMIERGDKSVFNENVCLTRQETLLVLK